MKALWAFSDGRVWGWAWRVETPHIRGRPFARGPTRRPIETRRRGSQTFRQPLILLYSLPDVKARLRAWEACA